MFTSADIDFEGDLNPVSKSLAEGAFICIKNCDFGRGAADFRALVKGKGRIEVRLDSENAEPAGYIEFDNEDFAWVKSSGFESFGGRLHNVYLVFRAAILNSAHGSSPKAMRSFVPRKKSFHTTVRLTSLIMRKYPLKTLL